MGQIINYLYYNGNIVIDFGVFMLYIHGFELKPHNFILLNVQKRQYKDG